MVKDYDEDELIEETIEDTEPEKIYLSRENFLKFLESEEDNNPLDDIKWVFHALGAKDLVPEDAPSSGAWNMLQTLKDDEIALKAFYTTVYPKLLPSRAQMEKGDNRAEDGRRHFQLIERLLREPLRIAPVLSDSETTARKLAVAKTGSGSGI